MAGGTRRRRRKAELHDYLFYPGRAWYNGINSACMQEHERGRPVAGRAEALPLGTEASTRRATDEPRTEGAHASSM